MHRDADPGTEISSSMPSYGHMAIEIILAVCLFIILFVGFTDVAYILLELVSLILFIFVTLYFLFIDFSITVLLLAFMGLSLLVYFCFLLVAVCINSLVNFSSSLSRWEAWEILWLLNFFTKIDVFCFSRIIYLWNKGMEFSIFTSCFKRNWIDI